MSKLTDHVKVFLEPLGAPDEIGVVLADGQVVSIKMVDENEIGVLVTPTEVAEGGKPTEIECIWSREVPAPSEPEQQGIPDDQLEYAETNARAHEEVEDGADEPVVQDGEA
jgi:hypothetical protein